MIHFICFIHFKVRISGLIRGVWGFIRMIIISFRFRLNLGRSLWNFNAKIYRFWIDFTHSHSLITHYYQNLLIIMKIFLPSSNPKPY